MKNKLTSAEYQALPIQLKNRYTRYSGSDEVYYELIRTPLPEAQPLEAVKTFEQILLKHGIYEYDTRINAAIADFNAQFATEAGRGKESAEQAAKDYADARYLEVEEPTEHSIAKQSFFDGLKQAIN